MTSQDFYQTLLEELYDGVYFVDRQRRITFWNQGAERLSGYDRQEVLGHFCWRNLLQHVDEHGQSLCQTACPLAMTLQDGQRREAQFYMHHKDGYRIPVHARVTPIRDDDGAIVGAVEIFSDNSAMEATAQELAQLRELAMLDTLTEVGNRRYMEREVHTLLEGLRRYGAPFGLLLVDIDWFKQVNDSYGHDVGDNVLRMVARTILHAVRAGDSVARWGGEEFLVALRNVSVEVLAAIAERLRVLVEESFLQLGDQQVRVTVSVGGSLARPGDTALDLFRRTDRHLLQSKAAGRNQVSVAPVDIIEVSR